MCHICGKISADQKVLDAHIKSHSQEEVSKAEILEEIGKAQKQAKQRKKTSAPTSSATSAEGRPAFSSPTPSEIESAVPAVTGNQEEEGDEHFTVVQVHQDDDDEEDKEKDDS